MYDHRNRAFIAAAGDTDICLDPRMANRHGVIAGATGTGKTVTLQTLAETFSQMGVPVFVADVKGDLSGIAAAGGGNSGVERRVADLHLAELGFAFQSFPVQFWDPFGERGAPIRATMADMGPLLLGRLLDLSDTQAAVLTVVFKIAQDENLAIIDLKDLQKILNYVGENAKSYSTAYGLVSPASIGAIQRALIALQHQGGEGFFGEPDLDIADLMRSEGGKGVVNILAAERLMSAPKVYATFLLWLLTRLFDHLPEVGDADKPKLAFFFDEAHLLFNDAPRALLDTIEQVVRLIRSKGVGIYFISQSPADIPDSVLGQLGNRVQHALRAYTPRDQKALKAAAQSFRPNPAFDTQTILAELGTGEALVSFLDPKGAPSIVERALILPPQGRVGPLDDGERDALIRQSPLQRVYARALDRASAYEILTERLQSTPDPKEMQRRQKEQERQRKQDEQDRKARERAEQRDAAQTRRLWTGLANKVVAPVARELLKKLFR
ncbi:MAG: helicase HerA-like domain-containing protein [Rhodospirillaceae bacterium]|nr:helicase HerA-like domain-containing protein [Rhodospirillaceae bacterium]